MGRPPNRRGTPRRSMPPRDPAAALIPPAGHRWRDWRAEFTDVFERDSQLQVLFAAIEAAYASDFHDRCHCVVHGPPGCGKTLVLSRVARLAGDESCRLDATSLTRAGAENLLLERKRVPRLLILEEPEKAHAANLTWLLGVMDDRAEISKTNGRVGSIRRDCRCVVLAAVNDLAAFRQRLDGTLASRFSNEIYFPRPSPRALERILQEQARQSNIDPRCVPATLRYCFDVEQTADPRRLIAVLKTGREQLLTGEFQQHLQKLREAERRDRSRNPRPG